VPSVDVMPTLCELMDAPCMADVDGQSLLPLISGERDDSARVLYATAPLRQGLRDMLIEGDYKLIVSSDGLELYDLAADPDERINLIDEHPDVVRRMRATLRELRQRNEERRRRNLASVSDEMLEETAKGTLEQMRALGYVE
jgi:arylsulfatase A-like enzyme